MAEGVRRVRVVVSGRVQGVFYRASCAAMAERAGVAGFVRNLGDGRVEAAFEGRPQAVEEMVEWARLGPRGARVERVEVHEEDPTGERSFGIAG